MAEGTESSLGAAVSIAVVQGAYTNPARQPSLAGWSNVLRCSKVKPRGSDSFHATVLVSCRI